MEYQISTTSYQNKDAEILIKDSTIQFGTTKATADSLASPADLFLASFSACMLKNLERFSLLMKFSYLKATLEVKAVRLENPPRMDNLDYHLIIYTKDEKLNTNLLKRNIEKFGTIYNTVKKSCQISGRISKTLINT